MKEQLHFIRSKKPYLENVICPGDFSRILFVRGRIANQRISSQYGAFLLFGHEVVLSDTGHSGLKVDRIYVSNKKAILQEFSRLNIKPSTIYPGIEETTREIARKTKWKEILNRLKLKKHLRGSGHRRSFRTSRCGYGFVAGSPSSASARVGLWCERRP